MKILEHVQPPQTESRSGDWNALVSHPDVCPWCGQQRIRGVVGKTGENPQYRCDACGTTFFIHTPALRLASRNAGGV
jgi:tRNA(Ile2) C34 agmatinyltransferase TiaS